ncbi:MAG: hypothetical protein WCJ58_02985 [bacterium]
MQDNQNQSQIPVQSQVMAPANTVVPAPVAPISVGNPEGSVNVVRVETAAGSEPQQKEFGYDQIKRIEKQPDSNQSGEKKEFSRPALQQNPQVPPIQAPKPVIPEIKPKMPSFFGYRIPPHISKSYTVISKQKTQGDTREARTWIYMLLDRLLKKQTYSK